MYKKCKNVTQVRFRKLEYFIKLYLFNKKKNVKETL